MSDVFHSSGILPTITLGQGESNESETSHKLYLLWESMARMREPWDDIYEETARYTLPRLSDWSFETDPSRKGKSNKIGVYDSTAINLGQVAADGLQGYIATQHDDWFKLETVDKRLMSMQGVRQWLQVCEKVMYSEVERSPFYHALSEALPIAVQLGTPTVALSEDLDKECAHFHTLHPKEVYLIVDRLNRITGWVRRMFMPAAYLVDEYGSKVPRRIRERAVENPLEDHLVLVFVLPRTVRDVTKLDKLNKPWATYHVLEETRDLLYEGGYDDAPLITHRLQVNSDEAYGRGWGIDVLPDILRLNNIQRIILRHSQLATDPPIRYPSEMSADIELAPGVKFPYFSPARQIEKIDIVGNLQIGYQEVSQIQGMLRLKYMYDFWISLMETGGQRTATEILERQGEKAAILGTMTSRIQNELITPMLNHVWLTAAKQGKIPEPPRRLAQHEGMRLKLQFTGPMAQLQKRFHAYQGVQQVMGTYMPLLEVWPSMRHVVEPVALGRHLLTEGGFPQDAVRSTPEVMAALKAEAEQMQQAQAMAQMEAAGKAAPAMKVAAENPEMAQQPTQQRRRQ
jgi:hypothetical protein